MHWTSTLFNAFETLMQSFMKNKSSFLLFPLTLLLLTACQKEQNDPLDYYFCSTSSIGDAQWSLYVDGDLVGQLPNRSALPNCNNTAALSGMLHLVFSEERHQFEAKDAQGTVRSQGYFKCDVKRQGQSSKSGITKGGYMLDWSCDHVLMSVFDAP